MNAKYNLLAVDDEKFNLVLLKTCLQGDTFTLVTCTDAITALDAFKHNDFDLILLDIIMQGVDGFELRKLIRELNKQVPIIFLTSMVDDINSSLLNRISDDQYTYYLNKSFDKKTLTNKILHAISIYREQTESDQYYQQLENDLTLAGDVQKILLPDWCMVDKHICCSYNYMPSMKVSGDIFILFPITEGRYLHFIGDIAGHGIQAALYMSAIQSFLKLLQLEQHPDELLPHKILNRLNHFFVEELSGYNYMTCMISIFDFTRNHVIFQSAGHPGMICCSPHNDTSWPIDESNRGSIPVGWKKNFEYTDEDNVEVFFDDDTIFISYTDGLLDLINNQEEAVGEDRFRMLLGPLSADAELPALPFRLRHALNQIGFDNAPDDLSLVALSKNTDSENVMSRFVPPEIRAVGHCVADFSAFVEAKTNNLTAATQVELLLSEFVNNIIIHGMESSKHRQNGIFISVRLVSEQEIVVTVMDRGKEWNGLAMSAHKYEEDLVNKNDIMATSGRGLAIIHKIASSISRSQFMGLNQTKFVIKGKLN